MLHVIWSGPIIVIISIVLLYQELGHAIWPGVLIMTTMIIALNFIISKQVIAIDSKQKKIKDERLSFVSEILNAIRVSTKLLKKSSYQISIINSSTGHNS